MPLDSEFLMVRYSGVAEEKNFYFIWLEKEVTCLFSPSIFVRYLCKRILP